MLQSVHQTVFFHPKKKLMFFAKLLCLLELFHLRFYLLQVIFDGPLGIAIDLAELQPFTKHL